MRWPWSKPRVTPYQSGSVWPKKVYFLDGPCKGMESKEVRCGREVLVPYIGYPRENPTWAQYGVLREGPGCDYWRYAWETVYPRAAVAYVRFIKS